MVNTKTKKDATKRQTRNASPKAAAPPTEVVNKSPKNTKETPKVYRKSPSRGEASKSPSRIKKSPPVSPGRPGRKTTKDKSPARSPKKSPARRKNSPARSPSRRSPARKTVTEDTVYTSTVTASRSQKPVIEVDSDSDYADFLQQSEKPRATVRGRARRLDSERAKDVKRNTDRELDSYIGVLRRSIPKSQPVEIERIVHLQEPSIKKLSEFSDEDEVGLSEKLPRASSKISEKCQKVGLTGLIGALLSLLLTPLLVLVLQVSCNETHCSLFKLPGFQRYKFLSTFFDKKAFLVFVGYTALVALLSAIPFGGPKVSGMPNKQGKLIYTINGLFIAAVTLLILFAFEFFNIPVISIVLQKYFQFTVSGILIACFISLYIYLNSFFVPVSALNPHAITNSRLYNFNIGRELNPRIFKNLDVKIYLLRILIISTVLLNTIFIYKSLEFTKLGENFSVTDIKSLKINPTLLTIGALQILFCLDFLIFEKTVVTSYFFQHEGVGYFHTICTFAAVFYGSSITKYIYDFKVTLPIWQLVIAIILFSIGYFLYRGSNLQKHTFRLNPYSPSISHLESLPTSQGKKLLVSGFWGFVRHPNYLGDILIQLSFAAFVLSKPPVIICLLDILFLIFRAHQDGVRCKQTYGAAWDRYCQRVKYVLIPKVY